MKRALFTTTLLALLLICGGVVRGQELLSNAPIDGGISCVSHPSPGFVYVGGYNGVYMSTDNGETWDMIFEYDTNQSRFQYLWFVDDSIGFASTGSNLKNCMMYDCDPAERTLYKTTNGGRSWIVVDTTHYFWNIKFGNKDTIFAISLTPSLTEFCAGTLFRSVDGGASWVCIYDDGYEIWDYSVVPPSTLYAMKSYKYFLPDSLPSNSPLDGTPVVLKSTDLGETWSVIFSSENFSEKLPITIDMIHFFEEGNGVLMGHYQIFTENDFETFETMNSGYHVSDWYYGPILRLQSQYLSSGYSVVTSYDESDMAFSGSIRLSKDKGHHYKIFSGFRAVCAVSGCDQDTTFFVVCPSRMSGVPSYIYRISSSDFLPWEIEEQSVNISIVPNPVSDNCLIRSESHILDIYVYDMLGREIIHYPHNDTVEDVLIPTSSWKGGTYFLRINTEKGVITKKVIKE